MENNDMKYPRIAEALRRIMDDHGGNKAAVDVPVKQVMIEARIMEAGANGGRL